MNQEKVWDEIAKDWRKFRVKTPPEVKTFLKKQRGNILDLGCGSGRNFMKLPHTNLYGVDFSSKMIELAKKYANKTNLKIKLKKARAHKLPFKDNFFDAILCFSLIHCIDSAKKREKTLKEIYRVLAPKGEAFISVWGRKSRRLKGIGLEKEVKINWTIKEKELLVKRYTYIYDKKELEGLVKSLGFKIKKSWEDKNINVILTKV